MWDLIVSVPDHCLCFYFKLNFQSLTSYNHSNSCIVKLNSKVYDY